MLAQNFHEILPVNPDRISTSFQQNTGKAYKLAICTDASVWWALLSIHLVHVYIVKDFTAE